MDMNRFLKKKDRDLIVEKQQTGGTKSVSKSVVEKITVAE